MPSAGILHAQDPDDADAGQVADDGDDLDRMSLEELMNVEVVTTSRRGAAWWGTPSAITVISQEDIRRSGATSIPEALRGVPGLHVARVDGSKWAVSARGFQGRVANKLLVMIDGRTLYTPLFSGTLWEVHDLALADVERIEVVRGPGGTQWGANAVSGVINIITKDSADTQGGLVQAGSGTEERAVGVFRWGDTLRDGLTYRVWGKTAHRDQMVTAEGAGASDDWDMTRLGARADWRPGPDDHFTLDGQWYRGDMSTRVNAAFLRPPLMRTRTFDTRFTGGHVLARWDHEFGPGNDMQLQVYWDHRRRDDEFAIDEVRNTTDVDFTHRFTPLDGHEVTWGLGYRHTSDNIENSRHIEFDPTSADSYIASAWVQDSIALVPDELELLIGSKFEINDYTGFEIQPSARMAWTPDADNTVWAAVSRAVRQASRVDEHIRLRSATVPGTVFPVQTVLEGAEDVESDTLWAYEIGWRHALTEDAQVDLALYWHDHDRLLSTEAGIAQVQTAPAPTHIELPLTFNNEQEAHVYGVELGATWDVTDTWRVRGSYTWTKIEAQQSALTFGTGAEDTEDGTPRNQVSLWSRWDLPHGFEFDVAAHYVDVIRHGRVPPYVRMDARLGWRVTEDLDVSLIVRNILDDRHPEHGNTFINEQASEVETSVFGMVTWRF